MAGSVQYRKDDDEILPYDEENPIRKTTDENPADFRLPAQPQVKLRILHCPPDRVPDIKHELQAQAGFAILVSERRLRDVRLRFRPDDQSAAHALIRDRIRDSTSSQVPPATGSFAYAASRASSNRISEAVNGSATSSHSSPSSRARVRRTSWRSASVSRGSSAKISLLLTPDY